MSGAELQARLLHRLAAMPFLDRLELAAVTGASERAAYYAIAALEDERLVAALPHASALIRPTRRFHLTARGLHRLAVDEGVPTSILLRAHPVSAQWRRILLQRLDAVAFIYRLAAAVAAECGSLEGFRWFRATALDAVLVLHGGRTVGIVRQGATAGRTAFAKRLRRLYQGRLPGALLVLASDGSRLQHARRLLDGLPVPAFLALECDAASAAAHGTVWNTPSGEAALSLRTALSRARPGGALPAERQRLRASMPADLPHGSIVTYAPRSPAVRPPEAGGEARPRSARRVALADAPHISASCWVCGRPASPTSWGGSRRWGSRSPSPPVSAAGSRSPIRGWRCSRAGTACPWGQPAGDGARPPSTSALPCPGATSPAPGAAICSGTSSTPRPSTVSSRRSRDRPVRQIARWRSSTRPTAPRGSSGIAGGSTRYGPTHSASSAGAAGRCRSSSNGSAAPSGP